MQPTSKQLHNYVGTAYGLAARHHCLRQAENRSGERFWGMVFPTLSGMEEAVTGEKIETYHRISMRIGRFGYTGWSLSVIDVLESIRPEAAPAKEFVFANDQIDTASVFSGGITPYIVLRSIYKIRWDARMGVNLATRRLTVHTHENETDGRMQADAFISQFDGFQELALAEMDVASVTRYDIDFMRSELEAHVEACAADD